MTRESDAPNRSSGGSNRDPDAIECDAAPEIPILSHQIATLARFTRTLTE
jgi:hypothetical protein